MPSMLCSHAIENPLGKPQGPTMPSFLDDRVDSDPILDDIRSIVEIESPSRSAPGVNRVLETIARLFEGTGTVWKRELTTDSFGDILLVRCDPTRNEPGIPVLSHMDTVHPVGTLTGKLTYRREGDRVYGPGIYDMKGGLGAECKPDRHFEKLNDQFCSGHFAIVVVPLSGDVRSPRLLSRCACFIRSPRRRGRAAL
jgi:hypothetical protein